MENCNHQFLTMRERTKSSTYKGFLEGLECICPLCGEVRLVWENGEIEIKNNEG